MLKDYSNKNLKKASFQNEDLANARFSESDLRGADFSGSDLSGADFSRAKTGITPGNKVMIFLVALVVSLLSGYIAMLAGQTVQGMLASEDEKIRASGVIALVMIVIFIAFAWWKGGGTAIRNLIIPACVLALVIGLIGYLTGAGTGMGMVYLVLVYVLVVIMFIVGTVSRAAAGSLSSNILFILVALGGGMFGKSVGGGIGTVIMAVSCALISKRALAGAKGFESLRKIAFAITSRFGTSFRNTRLSNANFGGSRICNSDFTNADVESVNWGDSKKVNCI